MAEVKRRKGETFESFLRRFNKRVQQSGKLIQSRKIRFHERPLSKTRVKKKALRRKTIEGQREYLKKVGKLKEESRFDRNYRRS